MVRTLLEKNALQLPIGANFEIILVPKGLKEIAR
jgi:hypothetical protein